MQELNDEIRNAFDARVRDLMAKRLGGPMAKTLSSHFCDGDAHAAALSEDLAALAALLEKSGAGTVELEDVITRGIWTVANDLQVFETYLREREEARYLALVEMVREARGEVSDG